MSPSGDNTRGRRPRGRLLAVICILILFAGGAVVVLRKTPRGPKLLNQPTKAREVRPLTTTPDPRFDPLPLEREKHGK